MNKLSKEQIDYIVEEYGSSKEIIGKIEEILSVINFDEDYYFELIIDIASAYETNELKKNALIEESYKRENINISIDFFTNEELENIIVDLERPHNNIEIFENIKEIIKSVLKFNLRNFDEKEKVYKLINYTLEDLESKKYV